MIGDSPAGPNADPPGMCAFPLSAVVLYLDFRLNYSVYVLSTINIRHLHTDYKFHVGTRIIWIVRPHTEGACAYTAQQPVCASFLPCSKINASRGKAKVPGAFFFPISAWAASLGFDFLLPQVPEWSKIQGDLYDVFPDSPAPIRAE